MRILFVTAFVALTVLLSPIASAFPVPQLQSVQILEGLPRATHHGVLLTTAPITDPNLQSLSVEVSRDNGATWLLYSNDLHPYDGRHVLLPYRSGSYGLATGTDLLFRLCAQYGSERQCATSPRVNLVTLAARHPSENTVDADDDILTALQEYNAGSDPRNPDSDDDWMADGFEIGRNLDPNLTQRPRLEVNVSSLDFGVGHPSGFEPPQHHAITLTNTGDRVLRISNGLFSGADPDQFHYLNTQLEIVNLPPHQSLDVPIDFLPTSLGARRASLDILSDDKDHFPVSIDLSGIGTAVAHLDVQGPARLDFPPTNVGDESSEQKIIIANPDSDRSLAVSLFLRDTLNFLAIPNRFSLAPGQSEEVRITFVPEWSGTYEGLLEIRGANAAGKNLIQIPITGQSQGDQPVIRLQTTGLAFGNAAVGTESTRQLIIFNDGDGLLHIKKIDFGQQGGGRQSGFRISSDSLVVPPHGSNRIAVTFTPTAATAYTSTLCLVTNTSLQVGTSTCQVARPIGQGLLLPNVSHAIVLSGGGV